MYQLKHAISGQSENLHGFAGCKYRYQYLDKLMVFTFGLITKNGYILTRSALSQSSVEDLIDIKTPLVSNMSLLD